MSGIASDGSRCRRGPGTPGAARFVRRALAGLGLAATLVGCGERPLGVRRLEDSSFEDFSAGSFSGGGAKIYATIDGDVRLLDDWDLDHDGYVDLVVSCASNLAADQFSADKSYIYWGSKDGISDQHRLALPSPGLSAAVADLDRDGHPDVVIARLKGKVISPKPRAYSTAPMIYWGSDKGPSPQRKTVLDDLKGTAINSIKVADLDRDGYLDMAFSVDGPLSSPIYWGGPDGFGARKSTVPTGQPPGLVVADLDRDGHLDLAFANSFAPLTVYWGDGKGYDAKRRQQIKIGSGYSLASADLDRDGYLDLILGEDGKRGSWIYWGSADGYSKQHRSARLDVTYPHEIAVVDLDDDGYLDIVYAEYAGPPPVSDPPGGKEGARTDSHIFWGGADGYSNERTTELVSIGAVGVTVVDLDADEHLDVVFSQVRKDPNLAVESYAYIGGTGRKFGKKPQKLDIKGGMFSITSDLGSMRSRGPKQVFTSRILDAGSESPEYEELAWDVVLPKGSSIAFELRSASSRAGLEKAAWVGPDGKSGSYEVTRAGEASAPIASVHDGHRFIQYRATLSSDYTGIPVLEAASVGVFDELAEAPAD